MNNKLLSICIPTFNRAGLLDYNLKILCNITVRYPEIDIVISDNCSTDNTNEIVEFYKKSYNNVFNIIQTENIGPDRNFESVLKFSNSKYKWLLGDSCLINENKIRSLLDDLIEKSPDLMVVDRGKGYLPFNSKTYIDASLLLEEIGWHITNISSLIFSNDLISNTNFERYYNTNFIQFGIIFEYLSLLENVNVIFKNDSILCSSSLNLIDKYKSKNTWFPNSAWPIFVKSWTNVVLSLPSNYSLISKTKCIISHNKFNNLFSVINILLMKNRGSYNYKIYNENKAYIPFAIGNKKVMYFILSVYPNWLNPYKYKEQIKKIIRVLKKINVMRFKKFNC